MFEKLFGRLASKNFDSRAPLSIARNEVMRRSAAHAGMVQFGSLTFRILRLSERRYGVVRLLDDAFLGCFEYGSTLTLYPETNVDEELLRQIANVAVRVGRTDLRAASGRSSR